MAGVALTALRGIDDVLEVRPGETLLVLGASGGIGHLAVQLGQHRGARVLAVASGADGVELARSLGADAVVDGRTQDVAAAAATFAPGGIDTVLLTAGGPAAEAALAHVHPDGAVAFPAGIFPEPSPPPGVDPRSYYGAPDRAIVTRLEDVLRDRPLQVNVAQTFPLEQAADAQRALDDHYLGKLALRIR